MSRTSIWAVAALAAIAALVPRGAFAEDGKLERRGSRYVRTIDKSFDVDPDGLLSIDAPNGPIDVMTWDKNEVRVFIEREVKSRNEDDAWEVLEDHALTVKQYGNEISITTRGRGFWDDDDDPIESSYRLTVPQRFNLELETSGASISVRDAHAGVSAKTSGGSVSVELSVKKGADVSSNLETSGGDVTIYVPDDLSATIDARIDRTKGKYYIHSEFPMELTIWGGKASATLKMGGGGDKIRLRTGEGEIHIRKL